MTELIIMFVSGLIVGAVAVWLPIKIKTPPACKLLHTSKHRQHDQPNRRRRDTTANMIEHIASLHRAQALSYPQAVTRIRTLEVATETAHRVLNARTNSL